jgi:hypothetical protein
MMMTRQLRSLAAVAFFPFGAGRNIARNLGNRDSSAIAG